MYRRFWIFWVLVFAGAAFLHFYAWDYGVQFLSDQARDATVVLNAYESHRPVLTGPTTSLGGLNTGPLFYYLYAPALITFQFHPISGIFFGFGVFVVSAVLLWYASRQFLSPRASVIAVLLFAASESVLMYTLFPWNPNLLTIFFLTWFLAMTRGIREKRLGWFESLVIAGSLAAMSHMHLSTLVFVVVTVLALFAYRVRVNWKWLVLGLLVFALSYAPLLAHNILESWPDLEAWRVYQDEKFDYGGTWYGHWGIVVANVFQMMLLTVFQEFPLGGQAFWVAIAAVFSIALVGRRSNMKIGTFVVGTFVIAGIALGTAQPFQWHYLLSIIVLPLWLFAGGLDFLRETRCGVIAHGFAMIALILAAINLSSSLAHLSDVRRGLSVSGYGSEYPAFQEAADTIAEDALQHGTPIRVDVHNKRDNNIFPYLLRTQHPDVSQSNENYDVHYIVRRFEDGVPESPYQHLFHNDRTIVFWAASTDLQ